MESSGEEEEEACVCPDEAILEDAADEEPADPPQPPALSCRVQALEEELKSCREELRRIQRKLGLSRRLHRTAETTNQELRTQVEKLSREIHEFNKTEKIDQEIQTDDYSFWSEYYQSSHENHTQIDADEGKASNGSESPKSQTGTNPPEHQEVTEIQYEEEEQEAAYMQEQEAECTQEHEAECTQEHEAEYTQEHEAEYTQEHEAEYTQEHEAECTQEHEAECTQEHEAKCTQEDGGLSLADTLRAIAEAALTKTEFVYDENTGMYYDQSTGFYYDSESQLYYDPSTGIYYYCDGESGRYLYHSKVDPQAYTEPQPAGTKKKKKKAKKKKNSLSSLQEDLKASVEMRTTSSYSILDKALAIISASHDREESASKNKKPKLSSDCVDPQDKCPSPVHSEPEEGEVVSDSEKMPSDEEDSCASSVSAHNSDVEDKEQLWAPCIRVIVVRSPVLQKGSLFIITAEKRATIGREKTMDHAIHIPEVGVSKYHAEVYFDHELHSYMLVDQGSQNGTFINGNQILQPKVICEPVMIHHGDEVKFAETVLSFHVHHGSQTCFGCEPGQVRAHLGLDQKEYSAGPVLNKEELRRKEMKLIRDKYGLKGVEYQDNKVLKNPKYKDRASRRRKVMGSENSFQRDDAPASVHVEINDTNKGRKMLEKMGWKQGEGLGRSGDGMKDPIHVQLRKKQAGLGAHIPSSIEDIQNLTQSKKNWEKARERYADIFPDAKRKDVKKTTSWVKSAAQ